MLISVGNKSVTTNQNFSISGVTEFAVLFSFRFYDRGQNRNEINEVNQQHFFFSTITTLTAHETNGQFQFSRLHRSSERYDKLIKNTMIYFFFFTDEKLIPGSNGLRLTVDRSRWRVCFHEKQRRCKERTSIRNNLQYPVTHFYSSRCGKNAPFNNAVCVPPKERSSRLFRHRTKLLLFVLKINRIRRILM